MTKYEVTVYDTSVKKAIVMAEDFWEAQEKVMAGEVTLEVSENNLEHYEVEEVE